MIKVRIKGDCLVITLPFRVEVEPSTEGLKRMLTRQELGTLEGLMKGLSNKEIAAAMNLSERTVKFHVSSLLRKTGTRSRADAVRFFHEAQLTPESAKEK